MMKLRMLSLLILICPSVGLGQGYRIESDRIVVEGDYWKAWQYPKGVLRFDEDGALHPRFVHKHINACLDAPRFSQSEEYGRLKTEWVRGGPRAAGSNFEDVGKVMDGDLSTFWEPSQEDPLKDWWFEIDLGRLVSAATIVLKFVEESLGDPFLQFKVEVSDGGRYSIRRSWKEIPIWPSYRAVWETTEPNEEKRLFRFELSLPVQSDADQFPGDVIRFVRVKVKDTKGDKREEVSKEAYERLDPHWRGRIEYYRTTASGEEWLTTCLLYTSPSPRD